MLTEALEHLVRGIVDTPEAVRVDARSQRRGDMLEVRVAPEDLGRVIGRQGRTATALRTVLDGLAAGASASGVDLGASENPVEPMLAEASAPVEAEAAPAGTEGAADELLASADTSANTEALDAVETEQATG